MIALKILFFLFIALFILVAVIKNLPSEDSLSLFKKLKSMEDKLSDEIREIEEEEKSFHIYKYFLYIEDGNGLVTQINLRKRDKDHSVQIKIGKLKIRKFYIKKEIWRKIEEKFSEINMDLLDSVSEKVYKIKKILKRKRKDKKKEPGLFYSISTSKNCHINTLDNFCTYCKLTEKECKAISEFSVFNSNLIALILRIVESSKITS